MVTWKKLTSILKRILVDFFIYLFSPVNNGIVMRVKLQRTDNLLLWLECTVAEAEKNIYPLLSEKLITESKDFIEQIMEQWEVSDIEDNSVHPHDIYCKKTIKYPACFNIDINLTIIEPAPATLPFYHMWDGYCPYSLIDEICFNDFKELKQKYEESYIK